MFKKITKTNKNQRGVTMIEYALLAVLIAIAAIVAIRYVGSDVNNAFMKVHNNLQ